MRDLEFYAQILGIRTPWRVSDVDLRLKDAEVIVKIEHAGSNALRCPECDAAGPGYDRVVREWRHLDTCQFKTTLQCAIPRVDCPVHGPRQVNVPWAEPGSRFTALMEALVIDWLREASISGVAHIVGLSWAEVDGIMQRAVARGLDRRDAISTTRIGVDEKARAKRHAYVTIVTDHEEGCVLYVAKGRKKETLAAFYEQIGPLACAEIEVVSMDMWPAFIEATKEFIGDAERKIAFDRFHVAQHIGNAVDQVRRSENKENAASGDDRLKGSRYLWLKNPENHTEKNLARFKKLERSSLQTAKAWRFKEIARHLWNKRPRMTAFIEWTAWWMKAAKSKLLPIRRVAETVRKHLWGIANAIELGATNGKSESFNAAVQKISTRAHGFRSDDRFANAIYFHLGGLDLYPAAAAHR